MSPLFILAAASHAQNRINTVAVEGRVWDAASGPDGYLNFVLDRPDALACLLPAD